MELFFKWLNKESTVDSNNNVDFTELKEIWDVAGKRDAIKIPNKEQEWNKIESLLNEEHSKGKSISLSFISKIAASIVFLLSIGALVYTTSLGKQVYQSQQTSEVIELPDGSEIILNKNSELVVKSFFNTFSRNVTLNGEAYFKVNKAKHPFIISTSISQIKVVGTEFNVKARPKKVELAVNEGIVDFSNINKVDNEIRVIGGYLSTCKENEAPVEPQKIKFGDYPGWRHGKLHFQDNSLTEICDELEFIYNIEIEIITDSIKENIVSGTLEGSDTDEIIKILCSLIQQEYKVEQGKYVIY